MSHGAKALYGVEDQLGDMNGFLHAFLALESGGSTFQVPLTPQHKEHVMRQAQKLENHLDDEQMVSLLTIFEKDIAVADVYLNIDEKQESLRKT